MTRESLVDLNSNTLIGQTAHRGTAWHYRADLQGDESNHYEGAVPVEDVDRRLFGWTAESRPLCVELEAELDDMTHIGRDGTPARWSEVVGRQAIVRSDTGHVMGIFADGYERHQYSEWLLGGVANLLDADLSISSAGLLRGGAVAWVEIGLTDMVATEEGVDFRPNLLATTSFDGSTATTYKRTITAVVCDNTRSVALGESGPELKVRHSRHSRLRLAQARDALEIVHSAAEDFESQVRRLCHIRVNAIDWDRFLDVWVPQVGTDGRALLGRAATLADAKRQAIDHVYRVDPRAAPWTGTAYGVIQAVNTYEHHLGVVRGAHRADRNMQRTVSGEFDKLDRESASVLASVLTR